MSRTWPGRHLSLLVATAQLVLMTLALQSCKKHTGDSTRPLVVGWQTAWSQQGQIVQVIQHTTIATESGLRAQFLPFQYGPDLNEAALTHKIDVTFAGIVPAVNLLARDPSWRIVGRFVDFPVSIIARANAGVKVVGDLKGKRFGVPIGGGSHPYAIASLREAGLSEGEGPSRVRILNLPPTEMAIAMSQEAVDAVAVWDPTRSILLKKGGNIVAETMYVGLVLAHSSVTQDKDSSANLEALLRAIGVASRYYATNRPQVDAWFSAASRVDPAVVAGATLYERNFKVMSPAAVSLQTDQVSAALIQRVAQDMRGLSLVPRDVDTPKTIDNTWAAQAEAWFKDSGIAAVQRTSVVQ